MNKWLIATVFVIIFSLSPRVHADLNEQAQTLCDKIKTCVFEQAAEQDLPPQVKEIMNGAFEQQCKQVIATYSTNIEESGLEDKASACVSSLQAQSCGEIMSGGGNALTPECETFQQAADEAGLDVDQ